MSDQIKQLILQALKEKGKMSRDQIKKETNLSRTTIYDNLVLPRHRNNSRSLIQMGLVIKSKKKNGNRGRPVILYEAIQ